MAATPESRFIRKILFTWIYLDSGVSALRRYTEMTDLDSKKIRSWRLGQSFFSCGIIV